MPTQTPNRWRLTVIRADGSTGCSFFCLSVEQRTMATLALRVAGANFVVEAYTV